MLTTDKFIPTGHIKFTLYDEFDNVKAVYENSNTITTTFKSQIMSGLVGNYTGTLKPTNVAFFSTPDSSGTLTGNGNLNGITASTSGLVSFTAIKTAIRDSLAVQYIVSHKNPASGSTQTVSSISLGRNWNSTYNQWNNLIAFTNIKNLSFYLTDSLTNGNIVIEPKERFTINWFIVLDGNVTKEDVATFSPLYREIVTVYPNGDDGGNPVRSSDKPGDSSGGGGSGNYGTGTGSGNISRTYDPRDGGRGDGRTPSEKDSGGPR